MESSGLVTGGIQTQQLCRFFSQGRHCNFGRRCRFLHARDEAMSNQSRTSRRPELESEEEPCPSQDQVPGGLGDVGSRLTTNPMVAPGAGRRPCRYFISGFCSMEDRCRFWHPPQFPLVVDPAVPGGGRRLPQRVPAPRPNLLQEVKLSDLTEDVAKQLRDTEIRQMMKRFPKDQLIVQEGSEGQVTFYRATVAATDPDWVNIA